VKKFIYDIEDVYLMYIHQSVSGLKTQHLLFAVFVLGLTRWSTASLLRSNHEFLL